MIQTLKDLNQRAVDCRRTSHKILASHESSISRVILLEDLAKKLSGLPIDVQDYFKESIACLQGRLFRAGIVTAWAGFFHVFSDKLYSIHEADIRSKRTRWSFRDLTELKEQIAESQIIDVSKEVKFITKAELRVLQGHLSTRNQCAHPTLYSPSLNATIGYVDEIIRLTIKNL